MDMEMEGHRRTKRRQPQYDIPFKNGEHRRTKRNQLSQGISKSYQATSIRIEALKKKKKRIEALRIILCGSQLHIFGPKLHPGSQPSFFMKVTCAASLVVFSACFLIIEPGTHSLLSINLLSVPFSPSWHCCCWCKILKNHVDLPYLTQGSISHKRLLHRFSLNYPISIFGFNWDH